MPRPATRMVALQTICAPNGSPISAGGHYELFDPLEISQHIARGLGRKAEEQDLNIAPPEPPKAAAKPAEPPPGVPAWTLLIGPEAYLAQWPNGPNAKHARAVLGIEEPAAEPNGEDGKPAGAPAPEGEAPKDPAAEAGGEPAQ